MEVTYTPGTDTFAPSDGPTTSVPTPAPTIVYDQLVSVAEDGSLTYVPYANHQNNDNGLSIANPEAVNTVPDFSGTYCK